MSDSWTTNSFLRIEYNLKKSRFLDLIKAKKGLGKDMKDILLTTRYSPKKGIIMRRKRQTLQIMEL